MFRHQRNPKFSVPLGRLSLLSGIGCGLLGWGLTGLIPAAAPAQVVIVVETESPYHDGYFRQPEFGYGVTSGTYRVQRRVYGSHVGGSIRIGQPDRYDRYDPYYGGDRYEDSDIDDSTLVNPVIIDSDIRDSTIINPTIIDSRDRGRNQIRIIDDGRYQRRGGRTIQRGHGCTILAEHRAACQ